MSFTHHTPPYRPQHTLIGRRTRSVERRIAFQE